LVVINGLEINVVAVLASAVAGFVLSFLWYGILFMKSWTKEMGYDPSMRPGKAAMAKGIVLTAIGSFLFAWVLAFYFAGWRQLPGSPSEVGVVAFALNSGLSVWLGFFLPVHLLRIVWEKHSWKLFAINGGYHLVMTAIVALIIASWT
jgi:hypothetical protein